MHFQRKFAVNLRWDKYLWAVRLAKTRSHAVELISKGRVQINGTTIKPSREPKVGDRISVSHNTASFTYTVIQLLEKRVGPKLVADYLLDTTTDEEREKLRQYQLAQSAYRQFGTGKPSKKDRRDLDDFMTDWEE
jgi:ribosome-associated heat shock protein Hsp15